VYAYNHAHWYVRDVLDLARVYGNGTIAQTADLERLQASLEGARRRVAGASDALVAARAREQQLRRTARKLHADVEAAALLSDRLAAERRAVLFEVRVDGARRATRAARRQLTEARAALENARTEAQAPSFSQGVGMLMGAPAYQGSYVFPVGGGPQHVSVAHTHHDYPAADIAAPMGAPVYALSNGVVSGAWYQPDARCGIGMTIRTYDGLVWTYCHLSYLEPSVDEGMVLSAGAPVGLVGSTGHSTGPHLHLQLQPATSYPQSQPWFQRFAGSAFRWQDAPTPLEPAVKPRYTRVFTVVPESRDDVIGFTLGGA
jgi:murein DD-endopeptidase MepM/ murein hydrolase activator NlpD